jgi:nitroreductase
MNQKFELLSNIIKSRRSTYPSDYQPDKISDEILNAILENARWAPNHKKTEPWRFVLITGNKLTELSDYMASDYKNRTPEDQFDPIKLKKASEKPLQSAAIIAICIHRSPESVIPPWEETAAVACAVQNIWLSCTALDIGAYWSTPGIIKQLNGFLGLDVHESCIGLFYMGWTKAPEKTGVRKGLNEILRRL